MKASSDETNSINVSNDGSYNVNVSELIKSSKFNEFTKFLESYTDQTKQRSAHNKSANPSISERELKHEE